MKIAFYAPMKPPDHPQPSGDRQVARLLLQALRGKDNDAFLASRLRSWDASGDALRQKRLQTIGRHHAYRLIDRFERYPAMMRPNAWVTYHLYHKAPDWLGPKVTSTLNIPYLVIEASYAAKQKNGPWSLGFDAAASAIQQADTVIALNSNDLPGIAEIRDRHIFFIPPFIQLPDSPNEALRANHRRRPCSLLQ